MKALTSPLCEAKEYQTLIDTLSAPEAQALADGCVPSQKLQLAFALSKEPALSAQSRFRLFITYSDKGMREIREEYLFYDRSTVCFPARDLIFYQADLRGKEIERERMQCLRRLVEGRPTTVVTTFAALMTPQVPMRILRESVLTLQKGRSASMKELSARLTHLGYE